MASSPITSWQVNEEYGQWPILLSWAPESLQMVIAAMKLKMLTLWKESYDQPRQHIKSRDTTLSTEICLARLCFFQ